MRHVLVVDDNPLSLEFFSAAIGTAGYAVQTACDGMGALECAGTRRFDLMLIDHRMPGLDGPQTLQAIRSGDKPSRSTPALATTADSGLSPDLLLAIGFEAVLLKPIGVRELLGVLARYLGQAADAHPAVLDDELAREKTGSDPTIVATLRKLLIDELDALPNEFRMLRMAADPAAIRDRLHRLDASAGFCGAPALALAIADLRREQEYAASCSDQSIDRFLKVCLLTRQALGNH